MFPRFLKHVERGLALALFATLAACGDDSVAPLGIFGRYVLQTVDALLDPPFRGTFTVSGYTVAFAWRSDGCGWTGILQAASFR